MGYFLRNKVHNMVFEKDFIFDLFGVKFSFEFQITKFKFEIGYL